MAGIKVVVTGGAGFIGSHIVEYWVKQGAVVHVIDNLRTGSLENIKQFPEVKFHKVSVTDKKAVSDILEGTDYVHHLAAVVSVQESIEHPQECVEVNTLGLLNVLEACRRHKIKKIVFSSSAAIYGDNPDSPKTISTSPSPKTPYGITKLDGEYYLEMFADIYGLNTVSLRYFNVYGPRQNPNSQYAAVIPIFIDKALKNEPIVIYGDGEQTRDFIYVKDIVMGNILAATNTKIKGIFNVALGQSTSIKVLAETIISKIGSKSKIIFQEERNGDIKHSLASVKETWDIFNIQPEYSLSSGLERTIKYFSEKLNDK